MNGRPRACVDPSDSWAARGRKPQGPDFLGIGVCRSGTTYLYHRLRTHPQMWLPPLKELHFFDRNQYGWPADGGRALRGRLRLLAGTFRRRDDTWKTKADVTFAWRYLRANPNLLKSYRRYFPDLDGRIVRGEITPDYCNLDSGHIEQIRQAFPELKLLLTLRHPLYRFESQVFKYLAQSDDPTALSDVWRWLDRSTFVDSFDYAGIVARWRRVFGVEKLHVAYFEELEENADRYFDDLYRFLGVDTEFVTEGKSLIRLNSSRSSDQARLPESLMRAFAEKILPIYTQRTGDEQHVPDTWRRDVQRVAIKS